MYLYLSHSLKQGYSFTYLYFIILDEFEKTLNTDVVDTYNTLFDMWQYNQYLELQSYNILLLILV